MLLSSHSKLLFFYSFYQNWFLIKNFQKILYSRIIIKDRVWIKNDSLERELRWEDLSDPCCSTGSRVPVTPGPYSPPQSTHNRGWLTEDWTRLLLTCLFYKFSYVASEWVSGWAQPPSSRCILSVFSAGISPAPAPDLGPPIALV